MLSSKWIKPTLFALLISIGMTLPCLSIAAENGALNYPAGSPGVMIGEFPPIPGLFLAAQTSFTTSDALYDGNGDEIEGSDFEMDVWVETFRFIASYPKQLWGARLYSQLVVPVVMIDNSLTISTRDYSVEVFDDDDTGLGNITVSPILLNWQKPESHQYFTAGMDVVFEAGGSYDKDNSVNAATGYNTIIPVAAYRYDDPEGLDIGIKANLMFNLENSNTDYDTGDMIAFDFMAGWNVGQWKFGLVGGYTDQYEPDQYRGNDVDDSDMRSLLMGPSVTYSAGPLMININVQKGLIAENTSKNDSYWVNIAVPLYVPNPPMPKE